MLEKIKKRRDFVRASQLGVSHFTPAFILQLIPNKLGLSRVGYTASKKVGNAVKRNRAKRRLRALAHEVLLDKAMVGYDYVFIARQAVLSRKFADMVGDLTKTLEKAAKEVKKAL